MKTEDVKEVADIMIRRHGKGASFMAYQHVTRTMRTRDREAAEDWCRVLVEVENLLNHA